MILNDKNRIDESLDADHHLIIGSTGSGKTAFIKRHPFVSNSKRIIAWDPEGSYGQLRTYTTIKGLAMALRAVKKYGNIHARFVPPKPTQELFEQFCQLVWETGHALNPTTVIGEELADVTKVTKATEYWGFLIRKGRKYGIRILGVSQRPQEIDKTFIGNCPFVWCGTLRFQTDKKYMADMLGLHLSQVNALQPLEFYIRHNANPAQRGKLTFKTPKA